MSFANYRNLVYYVQALIITSVTSGIILSRKQLYFASMSGWDVIIIACLALYAAINFKEASATKNEIESRSILCLTCATIIFCANLRLLHDEIYSYSNPIICLDLLAIALLFSTIVVCDSKAKILANESLEGRERNLLLWFKVTVALCVLLNIGSLIYLISVYR